MFIQHFDVVQNILSVVYGLCSVAYIFQNSLFLGYFHEKYILKQL